MPNDSTLTLHRTMYYSKGVSLRTFGLSFQSTNPTHLLVSSFRTTLLSVGLKDRLKTLTSGRRDFRRCKASITPFEKPVTIDYQSNEVSELSPLAANHLSRATRALRAYGWFGLWSQVTLVLVSKGVLLFSMAYTAQTAPRMALYLTAIGTQATLISCFQYFAMVLTSRKMKAYLEAPPGVSVKKVSKTSVLNLISQALAISISGLAVTIGSSQYYVGYLLAKALSSASTSPFTAGATATWNPVLTFDVFLLQASASAMLSHIIGVLISVWLLIKLGDHGLWSTLFEIPTAKS